ncbi:hypothetical protein M5D96_014144 [Drosophila gunungcola]|uniref:Uncharacterized protein n=1 Tax=Drosophila gunungcola TaxID=103775 RepID=A0A9P9YAQ9_9MUSC|nr:hypothetical protein M5D96_014144 [Drosophila gunungcola]
MVLIVVSCNGILVVLIYFFYVFLFSWPNGSVESINSNTET